MLKVYLFALIGAFCNGAFVVLLFARIARFYIILLFRV
jgi:hypothetical protein